jgi:hypothetical protein
LEDDSEDMDLLSARKTFRRSDRSVSHTPGSAQTSLGNGNWFNRQTTQAPPVHGNPPIDYRPRDIHAGPTSHFQPMPMQIPIAEMLNDPTWSQDQMSANADVGLGNLGDFDVNAVGIPSSWLGYD